MKVYHIYICCLALVAQTTLWAQGYEMQREKRISDEERVVRGDKLRGYRILPEISLPEQINLTDTITIGTHHYLAPEHRSLGVAYTGNFNSPWQSKIFFDRVARPTDFIYFSSFQGMEYRPDQAIFYDTKTPFTFVHYHKNFKNVEEEEVLKGTLSLNLGKKINLGTEFHYAGAEGFYNANRSKDARYRAFGSYRSDRYDLWAYVANDYYRISENAGIANLDYLLNPDNYSNGRLRLSSRDIPTRIPQDILYNRLRSGHAFVSHRYKLGYRKKVDPPTDSLKLEEEAKPMIKVEDADAPEEPQEKPKKVLGEFVPVGSLAHTVYYNKQSRRFISRTEHEVWSNLFGTPSVELEKKDSKGNVTGKYVLPNDTAALTTLHNTLSLSLLENFRPWVKFGLSGYLRTENTWISLPNRETGAYRDTDSYFSTFVGGYLSRLTGQGLNFRAKAELGILGKDLGAFTIEGDASSSFKLFGKQFGLSADAKLLNMRTPYFINHHHGTFGWWDHSFNFSRRLELAGRVNLDSWGTWAEARTATLQNYVYWGTNARPHQHEGVIQMTMLRAGHRYKVGPLCWDLEAAYQISSHKTAIPVPELTARADVYVDLLLFKVMGLQLGAEGYWHTSYYAPYYHPTHQQFVAQEEMRIGGEAPLLNAYANFRLKGIRFYLRMYNVGEAFMDNKRLSAHLYPYAPMNMQAGISVDLNN